LDKANKHIEFLSALQDKIPIDNAPQSPKKSESPSKIKKNRVKSRRKLVAGAFLQEGQWGMGLLNLLTPDIEHKHGEGAIEKQQGIAGEVGIGKPLR